VPLLDGILLFQFCFLVLCFSILDRSCYLTLKCLCYCLSEACNKNVPVVLIDMHSCSLDSKIRQSLGEFSIFAFDIFAFLLIYSRSDGYIFVTSFYWIQSRKLWRRWSRPRNQKSNEFDLQLFFFVIYRNYLKFC
jgi:hypothetical protein